MKYELFVYCRKDDVSIEQGKHAECEAETDNDACFALGKEAEWLLQFYDQIFCTVQQGDRVVNKWNLRPRPAPEQFGEVWEHEGARFF